MSNNHELQSKNLRPVSNQPETAQILEELSEQELASISGAGAGGDARRNR
jgi:bacteriocin-like protein